MKRPVEVPIVRNKIALKYYALLYHVPHLAVDNTNRQELTFKTLFRSLMCFLGSEYFSQICSKNVQIKKLQVGMLLTKYLSQCVSDNYTEIVFYDLYQK